MSIWIFPQLQFASDCAFADVMMIFAPTFMQLVIVVLERGDVARQVKHMARICSGCLGSNNLLKPSPSALVRVGAWVLSLRTQKCSLQYAVLHVIHWQKAETVNDESTVILVYISHVLCMQDMSFWISGSALAALQRGNLLDSGGHSAGF